VLSQKYVFDGNQTFLFFVRINKVAKIFLHFANDCPKTNANLLLGAIAFVLGFLNLNRQ